MKDTDSSMPRIPLPFEFEGDELVIRRSDWKYTVCRTPDLSADDDRECVRIDASYKDHPFGDKVQFPLEIAGPIAETILHILAPDFAPFLSEDIEDMEDFDPAFSSLSSRNSNRDWSHTEESLLIFLYYATHLEFRHIAAILGRSPLAVRNRCIRSLGFSPRGKERETE